MDIVYSYEKNKHESFLNDIKELQKELEKYNNNTNKKTKYIY